MTTLNEYRDKLAAGSGHSFTNHDVPDEMLTGLLDSLGLPIEDEKPGPGTWHLTDEGQPAFVDNLRWLRYVRADGMHKLIKPEDDWPTLTPAKVVPA